MAEHHNNHVMKPRLLAQLRRTRAVVGATILVERLWPLILPLVVVASLFLSLTWLGVFRIVPDWARLVILALLGIAALVSLWPFRQFRLPNAAEVDRRIERANLLEHAPVTVQSDSITGGDAFAAALWREHQKRMADRLSRLHGDLPKTTIPERDPWGIRAFAALLFVTALAFSLGPYGGRIGDALRPPAGEEAVTARVDAWVTPPAYTGRAPIFLTAQANQEQQAYTVPQNSTVAVRVSGGSGNEALSFIDLDGNAEPIASEEPEGNVESGNALRFSKVLDGDGTVSLADGGDAMAQWRFVIIPDMPPEIRFTKEPTQAANGTLELVYEIEDDHGAVSGNTRFALVEEDPEAQPLYEAPEMPLTLPGRGSKNGAAETSQSLVEHPWSGLDIELTLSATDAAEQTGTSETKVFELPQRPFSNPLAKALVEQRQVLALDARQKERVLALMGAVLLWPEETFDEPSHFLLISSARSQLSIAEGKEALRQVADDLWEIALIIEDGDMTAAERRLRQAQEALRQALEDGASEEEIARLTDELRQAMQDFLREFAERAMQNQDFAESQEGEVMRQSDLERMLDEIEELARSGAHEQAQDLLSQLENMMNNLQAGRPQQGQGGSQQSEMRQQMDQLGEIMRRQQELMNETFRLDQQQQGQQGQQGQGQQGFGQQGQGQQQFGQQGQGQQGQQGQGQGMSPQEFAEALRDLQEGQGGLRGDLQELMEGLQGLGIEPNEGFGEAGEAMGDAEGALGEGEGERAVGDQGRAIEALRRGAQDMMNQMQQAMQGQQGQGQEGGRQNNATRDPLGRPRATTGPDFGDSVDVPDEIDRQRAREILDAIRRRLGDALSPEAERDYLERLLDMR